MGNRQALYDNPHHTPKTRLHQCIADVTVSPSPPPTSLLSSSTCRSSLKFHLGNIIASPSVPSNYRPSRGRRRGPARVRPLTIVRRGWVRRMNASSDVLGFSCLMHSSSAEHMSHTRRCMVNVVSYRWTETICTTTSDTVSSSSSLSSSGSTSHLTSDAGCNSYAPC